MTLDGYTEAQLQAMHYPAFKASLDASTAYLDAARKLRDLPYPSREYADAAARAEVLAAAALQAHEHFGAIHDALTARQAEADALADAAHLSRIESSACDR